MPASRRSSFGYVCLSAAALLAVFTVPTAAKAISKACIAPSTYSAYSGTDPRPIPPAPPFGPANSTVVDPTFGSSILRVTDQDTLSGESFISTDAGFHRTWNANATAIQVTGPHGDGYWLEFNPGTFTVGDGSSHPVLHPLPINANWEWSAVNPDLLYFLNGTQLAAYNKATETVTNLGGAPSGNPVTSWAVVVGRDNWVCAAAGLGYQNTYTELLCINPANPSSTKYIDVLNKTINGVLQTDPNWPTSADGQTIGIHSISGGTGPSWLGVTFHQQSWGGNGDAVLNLATNTWSRVTNADPYASGHVSVGNGRFVNGSGSIDGRDSRGALVRDANNLMDASQYLFIAQPPASVNWFDAEHSSWLNSGCNANAPILQSRYTFWDPSPWLPWIGEITAAATDGSNTVWRFAHNHNAPGWWGYYGEAFAQISNDGQWALFSSPWDGTLGTSPSPGGDFGSPPRIDTFIVRLVPAPIPVPPTVSLTAPAAGSTVFGIVPVTAIASGASRILRVEFQLDGTTIATRRRAPYQKLWDTTRSDNGPHTLGAIAIDRAGVQGVATPVTVTVANPPKISLVRNSPVTTSSTTITWTTSTPSDSQVDSGTSTSYGRSTTPNPALVTSHSETLSGLMSGTLYHYHVRSSDAGGHLATSRDFTFTTKKLAISTVRASSMTTTGAVITWTTNAPADSQVEHGTSTVYGSPTTLNPALVTSHSQTLVGLSAGTRYHYRVKSRNASELAISGDFTFTTTAIPKPKK